MRARLTRLFCVILIAGLSLGCFAFAEGDVESAPVDRTVEEVAWDLSDVGFEVWTEEGGISASEVEQAQGQVVGISTVAPDATEAPEETVEPEITLEPEITVEPEPTEVPEPTAFPMQEALPKPDSKAQLGPVYFREALKTNTITLRRASASKSVIMGLPYVVRVKGEELAACASEDESTVMIDGSGALTLLKPGAASIAVDTAGGGRYTLALTVKEAPAPTGLAVTASRHKLVLHWNKVKHVTGYMVQVSTKGKKWQNFRATNKDKQKLNVTDAISGAVWLRVMTIQGDHFGAASEAVRVLAPVTDAKVIQEETYAFGPTDRVNITWSPSLGAYKYEVWRASLPSKDYTLIGATKQTWFADVLSPTQLYSYKIRPVWGGLENLPFCKPVNLWTGLEQNQLPLDDMTSSSGILLVVNKKAQVVTAYIRDAKGRYTLPLRHMICSTGMDYDRTRNGFYTINSHAGEWYTYSSGVVIRWPSVYRSGYYFHSPWYSKDHSTTLAYTVRRLGSRASAGCVRLKSNDSEWVYKHCPNGTAVWICDGGPRDSLKAALVPKDVAVQGF